MYNLASKVSTSTGSKSRHRFNSQAPSCRSPHTRPSDELFSSSSRVNVWFPTPAASQKTKHFAVRISARSRYTCPCKDGGLSLTCARGSAGLGGTGRGRRHSGMDSTAGRDSARAWLARGGGGATAEWTPRPGGDSAAAEYPNPIPPPERNPPNFTNRFRSRSGIPQIRFRISPL